MPVTTSSYGTRIDEIGNQIYRISTPVPPSVAPGGFSFNQHLIVDEQPMLFHTGSRNLFPLVSKAIEKVLPLARLKYIGFSHYEQDECGSLNELLAAAPEAVPVCSRVNAMINADGMNRPARALADGEALSLGQRTLRWLDTPHLPHGWECGYMYDESSRTLFCGDLFTQPGHEHPPLTEGDILGPSEQMRGFMDYFSHGRDTTRLLGRLAELDPTTLACMHGSAWRGRGGDLLRELGRQLDSH